MRIADLISQFMKESERIIDVTPLQESLDKYLGLSLSEIPYEKMALDKFESQWDPASKATLVIATLEPFTSAEEAGSALRELLKPATADTVWVFFFRDSTVLAQYTLEVFAEVGQEILLVARTNSRQYPYALVSRQWQGQLVVPPDHTLVSEALDLSDNLKADTQHVQAAFLNHNLLRLRNEYSFVQLMLDEMHQKRNREFKSKISSLEQEGRKEAEEFAKEKNRMQKELDALLTKNERLNQNYQLLKERIEASNRDLEHLRGVEAELLRVRESGQKLNERLVASNRDVQRLSGMEIELRRSRENEQKLLETTTDLTDMLRRLRKVTRDHISAERAELQDLRVRYRETYNRLLQELNSTSFRIGNALVQAVKNPRRETLAMPVRIFGAIRDLNREPDGLLPPVPESELLKWAEGIGPGEETGEEGDERVELERELYKPVRAAANNQVRIAGLFTRETRRSLVHSADVDSLDPNNWCYVLEDRQPEFVLVETGVYQRPGAWNQLGGEISNAYESRLKELVAWCRSRAIPVVLWDNHACDLPPRFRALGQLFDLAMTVEPSRFQGLSSFAVVHETPPVFQPRQYNPINGGTAREEGVPFVGVYDRGFMAGELQILTEGLEELKNHGLRIFDDLSGQTGAGASRFAFPKQYADYLTGRLSPQNEAGLFRNHRFVAFSCGSAPRSVDQRALSALACGARPILLGKRLPEHLRGILELTKSTDELKEQLASAHAGEFPLAAMRLAFEKCTCDALLRKISRHLGLDIQLQQPRVAVMARCRGVEELARFCEQIGRQSRIPEELHISLSEAGDQGDSTTALDEFRERGVSVVLRRENQGPESLGQRARRTSADFLCFWELQPDYEESYLNDQLWAIECSGASIVGVPKDLSGSESQVHRGFVFSDSAHPASVLTRRACMENIDATRFSRDLFGDLVKQGERILVTSSAGLRVRNVSG